MKNPLRYLLIGTLFQFAFTTNAQTAADSLHKGSYKATLHIINIYKHAADLDGSFTRIKGKVVKNADGGNNFEVINFQNPFNENQFLEYDRNRILNYVAHINKTDIAYYTNAITSYLPRTVHLGQFTSTLDVNDSLKSYRIYLNKIEIGLLLIDEAKENAIIQIHRPT